MHDRPTLSQILVQFDGILPDADCQLLTLCTCACVHASACVCFSNTASTAFPLIRFFFLPRPEGAAELGGERQNLHHLLPAVPRDEAGEAAVTRRRDPDPAVDFHQILPSEERTGAFDLSGLIVPFIWNRIKSAC